MSFPAPRSATVSILFRTALMLTLGVCGGITGVAQDAQGQDETGPCADTLEAATQAYQNRNYQEATALASQCTDREVVGEETAIRAYRVITLASLRQGAIIQARSAVVNILRIDPTYTADPVNDPPSYDLFVSMVRQDVSLQATTGVEADTSDGEETTSTESSPSPPQAQRTSTGFFIKLGSGASDYTGDMPSRNVSHPLDFQEFNRGSGVPFMIQGEVGYLVSSRWTLVLGFQAGNYPIVGYNTGNNDISDSWRYTPQFLVRYAFADVGESVAFYLDGGANATFGGKGIAETGYGPSVGGGVDVPVSEVLSFYVESRFNFTFPDDAIDGTAPTGSEGVGGSFDLVNQLLGVGLRIRFGGS